MKWYDSAPMGHNTIGNLMSVLSEKAGLSTRYTNHSLRATSVHVLDNIGNFAGRHIMTVTGHKSEASLKTYTGHTGENIKKKMSDTISNTLRCNSPKQLCDSNNNQNIHDKFDLQPLSNSQFDELVDDLNNDGFDDILSTIDISSHIRKGKENIPQTQYNGTWNYVAPQRQLPPPVPVLNYCSNVTINYNFK